MSQAAFREACDVGKTAQHYFETDQQVPGGAYLIAADKLGVDVLYVLTGRRCTAIEVSKNRVTQTFHAAVGQVAGRDVVIKRGGKKR